LRRTSLVAFIPAVLRPVLALMRVRWVFLAGILVLGIGFAVLGLDSQIEPMLCVSSGNMGPPAPTPPPPAPCPSGFGDLPRPRQGLTTVKFAETAIDR
jgi:hypothetical protein